MGKQLSEMTVEELQVEHDMWDKKISEATSWGAALGAANDFRTSCAREIERRKRAVAPVSTPLEDLALRGLQAAQELAHKTATDAGWYVDPKTGQPVTRNFGEVVALMHSELSEALEADRKGLMDDKLPHRSGVEVEFADCIIRILDTAAALGLDLAGAVIEKNRFNRERADHKLANRAAAGGKKY